MKTTDNTTTVFDNVNLSADFIKKIANKDLKELQKENLFFFPKGLSEIDDLSDDQRILEANSTTLKTTNIMGVIGYNKEKLFIGSRFDNGSDYFFYYLLKRVLNLNFVDKEVGMQKNNSYLDLLILLFPKYLNEALKKGLYKEYRVFQYNDFNVRGVIDIKRQIKDNIPFAGKIAYRSREYSYENQVINLVRYTIEFIKKRKDFRTLLTMDAVTRENVKVIEERSQGYRQQGLRNVYHYNLRKPVRHGYFFEYRTLQKLCLSILNQEASIYEKCATDQVYGLLFDGAWLFEEYINLLIRDEFIHPQNKQKQGQQYLFGDGRRLSGKVYPDFISKKETNRIIADAKYKPASNIYGKDYLQLVAYMYRFEAKKGYYLYPYQSIERKSAYETLHLLQGINEKSTNRSSKNDITIIKLGLQIPALSESFEEFESEMKFAEDVFKRLILDEPTLVTSQ